MTIRTLLGRTYAVYFSEMTYQEHRISAVTFVPTHNQPSCDSAIRHFNSPLVRCWSASLEIIIAILWPSSSLSSLTIYVTDNDRSTAENLRANALVKSNCPTTTIICVRMGVLLLKQMFLKLAEQSVCLNRSSPSFLLRTMPLINRESVSPLSIMEV